MGSQFRGEGLGRWSPPRSVSDVFPVGQTGYLLGKSTLLDKAKPGVHMASPPGKNFEDFLGRHRPASDDVWASVTRVLSVVQMSSPRKSRIPRKSGIEPNLVPCCQGYCFIQMRKH